MKCPICGKDFVEIPSSELKIISKLFSVSLYPFIYNSLGIKYSYCPNDFISAGEYNEQQIALLKNRFNDLKNTFNNSNLEQIDTHKWARIAEITGFTNEILCNYEVAANAYKHSSDILDELCAQFINLKGRSAMGDKGYKVVSTSDFNKLKSVMTYSQNLKRLALSHYSKAGNLTSLSSIISLTDSLISLKSYQAASVLVADITNRVKGNSNFIPLIKELNKKLESLQKLDEANSK